MKGSAVLDSLTHLPILLLVVFIRPAILFRASWAKRMFMYSGSIARAVQTAHIAAAIQGLPVGVADTMRVPDCGIMKGRAKSNVQLLCTVEIQSAGGADSKLANWQMDDDSSICQSPGSMMRAGLSSASSAQTRE